MNCNEPRSLATAHLLALDGLDEHSQLICKLGSGNGFSMREVIEVVRKVTEHPIPVVEAPRWPALKRFVKCWDGNRSTRTSRALCVGTKPR
jgi:nucleoside-diphosphate-sugar epimerase